MVQVKTLREGLADADPPADLRETAQCVLDDRFFVLRG